MDRETVLRLAREAGIESVMNRSGRTFFASDGDVSLLSKFAALVLDEQKKDDCDINDKPAVQTLMDLARKFRSAHSMDYDAAYKELEHACYRALNSNKLNALVCAMQADMVKYLAPDGGVGKDWFVSQILGHLDGPQQREAQYGGDRE